MCLQAQICVSPAYDAANLTRPSYTEFQYDEFEDAAAIKVSASTAELPPGIAVGMLCTDACVPGWTSVSSECTMSERVCDAVFLQSLPQTN